MIEFLLGVYDSLKTAIIYVLAYLLVMFVFQALSWWMWLKSFDDDDDIGPGPYYTP